MTLVRRTALAGIAALGLAGAAQAQDRAPQPPRDTPARQGTAAPTVTGVISGRVLAADTGRPIRRARVLLAGGGGPQNPGRGVLTDDAGAFEVKGLPEGRYTVTASKTGFVTLSYGQRRPQQAGTPLQLAAGAALKGIEFRLPRGGVITGHVFDDTGEPMPGTTVRVMAYRYSQGSRQLIPGGSAQTDDRGEYRVWSLNPGEYYVTAIAPNRDAFGPAALARPEAAAGPDQVGYAPTYYPGVPSVDEARPVTVGLGAEVSAIDFSVLLVRTSRIGGRVVNPDGSPATGGTVQLSASAQGTAGRGRPASVYGGRIQADGQFSIANVPPGRYTLRARGAAARIPAYATQPVMAGGGDIPDVSVVLAPAATISGAIRLESTRSAALPNPSQWRVAAPALDLDGIGPNSEARVDQDGDFTLEGLPAGPHWLRGAQTPRGWMLKSVLVDGRETIDAPFTLDSGQKLTGVTVVFTDQLSEISGTVTDARGVPVTELTVLAFPRDDSLWRPQARQIMTARPDQNGKFQMRGLPPGQYYLAAIDPAEQGEWFEPAFLEQQRPGAVSLTLVEGDIKTQDFTISP